MAAPPFIPLNIAANRAVESHAHRLAKLLLVRWLREAAAEAGHDNYADFAGLGWRVNRPGPYWGVWSEYPVLAPDGEHKWCTGLDQVWDETGWDDADPSLDTWESRAPPTFDDLLARGMPPAFILDIAIQHKGAIIYGIEIVHKHGCGEAKVTFFRNRLTHFLEIPAYWVLGQVHKPVDIPAEFYLS